MLHLVHCAGWGFASLLLHSCRQRVISSVLSVLTWCKDNRAKEKKGIFHSKVDNSELIEIIVSTLLNKDTFCGFVNLERDIDVCGITHQHAMPNRDDSLAKGFNCRLSSTLGQTMYVAVQLYFKAV